MQQSTNRGITMFNASFNGRHKHKAIASNENLSVHQDVWGFKMQKGRSFIGSGEDVPANLDELKSFNLSQEI